MRVKKDTYTRRWIKDFFKICGHELKMIFSDGGAMLIFFVAGLLYPLLYNVLYLNGVLYDSPVAVVDEAGCSESRRMIREIDATPEVKVAYKCLNMDEARRLMEARKVNGIFYFPGDFGDKIVRGETSLFSIYCDMSSFLYYKNALMAGNHVMLDEIGRIQIERYAASGLDPETSAALVQGVPYEESNPYNKAFSYSFFLISAILFVIIQQTMYYGMSLLTGTQRERNKIVPGKTARLMDIGAGRIVLGRGAAYWLIYMIVGTYIAFIVPAIFGVPQRGAFLDVMTVLLFFVIDCVFFCQVWSALVNTREKVFVLFLFMSPVCLFLTGTSWPMESFPGFWKLFASLFPTTYGCQAYINVSVAGGDLNAARSQIAAMTIQTVAYFSVCCAMVHGGKVYTSRRARRDAAEEAR